MKHNSNSKSKYSAFNPAGPETVSIRFEIDYPQALAVSVSGTFNDWDPSSRSLHTKGDGRWWREESLAPGVYEYCLVVDGRWMPDPMAPESLPNPFGGRNSVLRVPRPSPARLDSSVRSSSHQSAPTAGRPARESLR